MFSKLNEKDLFGVFIVLLLDSSFFSDCIKSVAKVINFVISHKILFT